MEILFGPEIPVRLVRQIEQAQKLIVLVSPYFDPWHHLTMAVRNAIAVRGVRVVLILRGGEDRARQEEKASAFAALGVSIKFVERLHAKLYICDDTAFITSLNLLRSSMEGSYELASIVSRKEDPRTFSQLTGVVQQLVDLVRADEVLSAPEPAAQTEGYCLRCKAAVALNPEAPYCRDCYKSWSKWKNADYTEKYCHRCGSEAESSLSRPECRPCYRASR